MILNDQTSGISTTNIRHFTFHFLKSYAKHFPPFSAESQRRVLISHGREIVNGVELFSEKLSGSSKRRLIDAGVRSLRAAGDPGDTLQTFPPEDYNDNYRIREDFTTLGLFL
jgi:hypothetical protein